MAKIRIALTGGGSGGHIYPLLAVAEELQRLSNEKNIEAHIEYLGPRDAFSLLLRNSGIGIHGVMGAKLRSYSVFENILDIPKFFIGLLQAFWKLFWIMPDVIFSKGGPGAFPVVFAGWFYRIPILIHESDAIPGSTNLLSSRFATRIALAFREAGTYFDPGKTAVVGNPIRPWLLKDRPEPQAAKQLLGFKIETPLTVVLGGSQGSKRINEFIVGNLGLILKETQILHQTGSGNFDEMETLSKTALEGSGSLSIYKIVPYVTDDLKTVLAAADCIIARAGSGTLAETASFGKPMILIPLPESAHGHQRANARVFEKCGGGVIIEETNLLPGIFMDVLKKILENPETKKRMGAASSAFPKPEAAEILAKEVLLLAGR